MRRTWAAAIALTVLATATVAGQMPWVSGVLTGRVIDAAGAPVPGTFVAPLCGSVSSSSRQVRISPVSRSS
jgi:hypothetical protein